MAISSLCHCVRVTTRLGDVKGYTSHDYDITIDGVTYLATSAFDPTAIAGKSDLSADNLEVKAIIGDIDDYELRTGVYDDAQIVVALVDFIDLPDTIEEGVVLAHGHVGQIRLNESFYTLELRSLMSRLNQGVSNKIMPLCRWKFCSPECGLDIEDFGIDCEILTIVDSQRYTTDYTFLQPNYKFYAYETSAGWIRWTSGQNEGLISRVAWVLDEDVNLLEPPPYTAVVGDTFRIYQGCSKGKDHCQDRSNFDNFGGIPTGGNWVPGIGRVVSGS